jgi:hypothetical protein
MSARSGSAVFHGAAHRIDAAAGHPMNPQDAIDFVDAHGIVLESARGPIPSLAEAIAGEPIHGNWWSHPRGREIFQVTRAARACDQILVCRLIRDKITYVHRRLWPSIVRAKDHLDAKAIARIEERHSDAGRHLVVETSFPEWVPVEVAREADELSEESALAYLQSCAPGIFGSP